MKRSMYRWDGSPSDSRDENTAVALGGGMVEIEIRFNASYVRVSLLVCARVRVSTTT